MKINNTILRTLSGIVLILVFLGALLLGKIATLVILSFIYFVSIHELKNMFRINKKVLYIFASTVGIAAILLGALFAEQQVSAGYLLLFLLLVVIMIILFYTFLSGYSIRNMSILLGGGLWIATSLTTYYLLGWEHSRMEFDPHLMILLIVMIWVNDVGAFVIGSLIGKTKLAKKISPEKTWEGFLGGFLLTIISGLIIAILSEQEIYSWLLLGATISITSTIGDLFESKIKREAGVKDSGHLIPGHGGILDRFDSLFFSAPVFYLLFITLQ